MQAGKPSAALAAEKRCSGAAMPSGPSAVAKWVISARTRTCGRRESRASTLGLVAIAEQARALEVARRPEAFETPDRLVEAIDAIDHALLVLRNAVDQSQAPARLARPPDAALDTEQTRALLDELAALLREDNARAFTLYQHESARLAAIMPDEHTELARLIDRFDFESALELIETVQARSTRPEGASPR